LHIAQLMPLPLTISCSSKSRLALSFLVLPFWYLLTRVVPDIFQKSSKTVVCVCVLQVIRITLAQEDESIMNSPVDEVGNTGLNLSINKITALQHNTTHIHMNTLVNIVISSSKYFYMRFMQFITQKQRNRSLAWIANTQKTNKF